MRYNFGDHQCGFQRNRSTTDHLLRIRQILEKKWEYNEAVYRLFIDFKKAYETGKANKNVYDCNVQQSPDRREFV
jgi:hypothetical protein